MWEGILICAWLPVCLIGAIEISKLIIVTYTNVQLKEQKIRGDILETYVFVLILLLFSVFYHSLSSGLLSFLSVRFLQREE